MPPSGVCGGLFFSDVAQQLEECVAEIGRGLRPRNDEEAPAAADHERLHGHRDDAGYRSLGASGAVSAVLFAYILIRPWSMILVFAFPVPAIVFAFVYLGYTIYMDRRQTDRINHSAHLWGAVYGILFTLALDPGLFWRFLEQLAHPRFGGM